MEFWELAYTRGWVDLETLRLVVITEASPYGDITPEEFERITGIEF